MSYTPAALELLFVAADRSAARKRAEMILDMRNARFAEDEDFKKLLRQMQGASRASR